MLSNQTLPVLTSAKDIEVRNCKLHCLHRDTALLLVLGIPLNGNSHDRLSSQRPPACADKVQGTS